MKSKREQRHASIVFRNGCPIGFGYNNSSLHAEQQVVDKLIPLSFMEYAPHNYFKGMIMVNIRITRGNKIGLAKPCPACYELLKEKKFRKIIYSDNNGRFVEEYL